MLYSSSFKKKIEIAEDIRRRLGRFYISSELLSNPDENFFEFMKNFLIIRAEHHWIDDKFEYIAMSNLFKPKKEGEMAPEYTFTITIENNKMNITAQVVADKGVELVRLLRKIDIA